MSSEIYKTPLAETAVMLHEMYRSLLAAGFTPWEATRILGATIAESGRQQ